MTNNLEYEIYTHMMISIPTEKVKFVHFMIYIVKWQRASSGDAYWQSVTLFALFKVPEE